MSRHISHIQRRGVRMSRGSSLVRAVVVALTTAALLSGGVAASSPVAPGPGSPEWTRHLELEYGRGADTSNPVAPGPGSPEWTRHLELEYGA